MQHLKYQFADRVATATIAAAYGCPQLLIQALPYPELHLAAVSVAHSPHPQVGLKIAGRCDRYQTDAVE